MEFVEDRPLSAHQAEIRVRDAVGSGGQPEAIRFYRTAGFAPENQFGTIMTVKSEVFPKAPYPNWTAIGVNWLAGFDFEIKVIARIPG